MEDQKTQQQYSPPHNDVPPRIVEAPRKDGNRMMVALLGTVIALVTLVAAGSVVLLVSQSNVSTHNYNSKSTSSNNSSSSNNNNNRSYSNTGGTVVVPQPAPAPAPAPAGFTPGDENPNGNYSGVDGSDSDPAAVRSDKA
jgi:hypothetical protein